MSNVDVTRQGRSSRGAHRRLACSSCDIGLDELEAQRMAAYGGRCTNCQQLHKEGSFCPVCSKVRARGLARPRTMPAGTAPLMCRLNWPHTASASLQRSCQLTVTLMLKRTQGQACCSSQELQGRSS